MQFPLGHYNGEQRFGRGGGNLKLADDWAAGRRLPRAKRSLAISTIRSFLFNEQLAARVHAGDWDAFLAGDKANLEGSASVFAVESIDDALNARSKDLDIHPAIDLANEHSALDNAAWQGALQRARVEPASRSLRFVAMELSVERCDAGVRLEFNLGRGVFATSLLREICRWS